MPPDHQLAEIHSSLARLLARSGADEARKATEHVVGEVGRDLEAQVATTPVPEAADLPTPLDHWAATAETYLLAGKTSGRSDAQGKGKTSREFRQEIFQGLENDASPFDAAGETHLAVADYLEIMRRKIGRLAQTYGTRLIEEIQSHLDWLADRYRRVGNEVDRVDSAAKDVYRTLCERLAALQQ